MGAEEVTNGINGAAKEVATEDNVVEKAHSGHTERRENFVASVGLTTVGEWPASRKCSAFKSLTD